MPAPKPLIDGYGRLHTSLRISVTDRCNINCFYCMPERPVEFVSRREILSYEEIEQFARIAAKLGVRRLRVTGGEPLARRELHVLIRLLAGIDGIEDLALTTNGLLLADQATALYEAGLRRINIHLDTLDRERFREITRYDGLDQVLTGIHECRRLGYHPIKINAVAVKGFVEEDIVPLANFAREHLVEVRYIEFMPLDSQGLWLPEKVLRAETILEMLRRGVGPLEPVAAPGSRAPASEYRFSDGVGRIGLIAPVSRPFCKECDRIRLTADGKLRYCLFAIEETDVKGLLRRGIPDDEIVDVIRATVASKWQGHEINSSHFVPPPRPMYAIGG